MITDLQVTSLPPQHATPLESVLGSAQGRYFGAGYRSVNYSLREAHRGDGTLTALGRVSYPSAWSTDAGGKVREPHLSSIDAVLLPMILLEQEASPDEFQELGRLSITHLHLAAGANPFVALGEVPIRAEVEEAGRGMKVRALVGNIKVGLTLEEKLPTIDLRRALPSAGATSVYSQLFRHIDSTSWICPEKLDATRLIGEHVLTADASTSPSGGIEAMQWPAPTVIDYLVIMGQLTQALVYTAAGRHRATSGPLWMRSIDIAMDGPGSSLPARFGSRINLLRDRPVQRHGTTLHDCKVEAFASTGVSAVATLAYQERDGGEDTDIPPHGSTQATTTPRTAQKDGYIAGSRPCAPHEPDIHLEPVSSRVLQVAAYQLSRMPLVGVSLQGLADDAGMPLKELQQLFSSMHEIGTAILDHERSRMAAIQAQVLQGGGPPLDQVVLAFRLVGKELERDVVVRAGVRLALESKHAFPERRLEPMRTWDGFLEDRLRLAESQSLLRADADIVVQVRKALGEALSVRNNLVAQQTWSSAAAQLEQVGRRCVENLRCEPVPALIQELQR